MTPGVADYPLRREPAETLPLSRGKAYWELMGTDHGFLRSISFNLHEVGPGMYRSSQPAPYQIRRLAEKGIKTIVNLRGIRACGSYHLEVEACRKYGIELVNFRVKSREAPSKDVIYGARKLFQEIAYPALMHCKSGADRAGIGSFLYKFIHEGAPADIAKQQLALKYGHFRQGKTGILDYFVEAYQAERAANGTPFWTWVENGLDPDALRAEFRTRKWGDILVDTILRRE